MVVHFKDGNRFGCLSSWAKIFRPAGRVVTKQSIVQTFVSDQATNTSRIATLIKNIHKK